MCVGHKTALIRSKEGRDVLAKVPKRCDSKELETALIDSVLAGPVCDDEGAIHTDAIAHLALRRILQETTKAVPHLASRATSNRGSFVVLGIRDGVGKVKNVAPAQRHVVIANGRTLGELRIAVWGAK